MLRETQVATGCHLCFLSISLFGSIPRTTLVRSSFFCFVRLRVENYGLGHEAPKAPKADSASLAKAFDANPAKTTLGTVQT